MWQQTGEACACIWRRGSPRALRTPSPGFGGALGVASGTRGAGAGAGGGTSLGATGSQYRMDIGDFSR